MKTIVHNLKPGDIIKLPSKISAFDLDFNHVKYNKLITISNTDLILLLEIRCYNENTNQYELKLLFKNEVWYAMFKQDLNTIKKLYE